MIGVQVIRRPAGDEEIERALAQLDQRACIYFGCDAGVARSMPGACIYFGCDAGVARSMPWTGISSRPGSCARSLKAMDLLRQYISAQRKNDYP
jgi:hypothetical protein